MTAFDERREPSLPLGDPPTEVVIPDDADDRLRGHGGHSVQAEHGAP